MKVKLYFLIWVCIHLSFICVGQSGVSNTTLDKSQQYSDKLRGAWIFDKAQLLERKTEAQPYTIKSYINKVDDLESLFACSGPSVKNLFFVDDHVDVETAGGTFRQAEYALLDMGNRIMMEVAWYNNNDNNDGQFPPVMLRYWIEFEDDNTLKVTYEVFCKNEKGEVPENAVVSFLKRS